MTQPLPTHVQAIFDEDFSLEQCFDIMRAARIKAEHVFCEEAAMGSTGMAEAVHQLFTPLNDLSDEIEVQLGRLKQQLGQRTDA